MVVFNVHAVCCSVCCLKTNVAVLLVSANALAPTLTHTHTHARN